MRGIFCVLLAKIR